jgi:PAS domain S-box-containing protein
MSDAASEKQRALQQVEKVLQDSKRLFRAIWEHASDAMVLSTFDGTVFAANPAYFHLYGYPPEDVIGKNFSIIFPEEHRTLAQEMYGYFFHSATISPSL